MVKVKAVTNSSQFFDSWQSRMRAFLFHVRRPYFSRYILNRFYWQARPALFWAGKFPDHIDIESTSVCNMKCPMCYKRHHMVKQGFMDFELFKKIVDECSGHGIYSMRLSWRGEPLMHKRIIDMIRYAKKKGIKESMILTNGSLLSHEMSEALIRAGLGSMSISLDGIGKVYEEIRDPAKFDEQVDRIRYIFNMRKKLQSLTPKIKLNCLWKAVENDHKEYLRIFRPISDAIYFNKYVNWCPDEPLVARYRCPVVWQRLFITWDGTIVCDGDHNEVSPIAKYDGKKRLIDIWQGPEYTKFRNDNKKWKRLKYECCQKCYYGRDKKVGKYEYN